MHPVNQLNLPARSDHFLYSLKYLQFFIVYFDKKSHISPVEVSERKLFLLALAGGAIGIFSGDESVPP